MIRLGITLAALLLAATAPGVALADGLIDNVSGVALDSRGQVVHIHENAIPLDRTPIRGGDEILAVLEINGGMSEMLNLQVGAVIRHPQMPQQGALWPCEVQ